MISVAKVNKNVKTREKYRTLNNRHNVGTMSAQSGI